MEILGIAVTHVEALVLGAPDPKSQNPFAQRQTYAEKALVL